MRRDRPGRGRAARAVVVALVVGLTGGLGVHAAAGRVQLTDAAWTDRESVSGTLGTRSTWCDTGLYRTAGRGQLVAGQVGTGSTDTVPAVAPLRVTQSGSGSSATPAGATALGSDAWVAPLTATALQAGAAPLGSTVTFPGSPTATQANQYARATSTGAAAGASGTVSDAGVVASATQSAGSGFPDLAAVDARALVGAAAFRTALGTAPDADLTGVRLVPGLVASSTVRDACISRPSTTRAYGVSSLRLEADSTALRAASTTATSAATSIQNAVTGTGAGSVPVTAAANVHAVLVANQEALNLMTPGTSSTATLSMSVAVNVPAAVAALTGQTLGAGGPVRLDLATGRMTVDIGALTSGTAGVNALAPNTEVLTAAIMESAATSVGTLLPAYQTAVLNAISTALATSTATLTVTTSYSLLNLGVLIVEPAVMTFVGTLNQLRAQQGTLTTTVGVNNTCGLVTAGSCSSVRNFATSANGSTLLRTAVANALTSTIYGTSTTAPVPPSGTVVAAVTAATGTLQPALRALPAVLSAQVNVQPDVAGARTGVAFAAGEVGVTALRLGATNAGRTAWLAFGTSAAGPLTYQPNGP